MDNLSEVIEDSITDIEIPTETETEVETAPETVVETPQETPESSTSEVKVEGDTPPPPPVESKPSDDFEKKYGIPAASASGRENRIPYSRVKKITEKAINDKVKELEGSYTPKIKDYETKIKEYETQLGRVAEFEKVMVNDSRKFLSMLATLPAYADFFKAVEEAFKGGPLPVAGAKTEQPQAQAQDDMPQPDQALPDGTKVYSMEGLKALNAWNRAQAKKEAMEEVSKRYKPMEDAWQAEQRLQELVPKVQAQITDARTWPLFNDNEDEIVKVLQGNPKISLEGAYRQVVFPKIVADRNKIREEVLKEVKQAPVKSTAATTSTSTADKTSTSGPRSLEEVIADSISTLKR